MFSFERVLIVIAGLLVVALLIVAGRMFYLQHGIEEITLKRDNMKTQLTTKNLETRVVVFETNQTAIFMKEKEFKYVEIFDGVGFHTLSI